MSKNYWYILHIPTGFHLRYSEKSFSKKRYKEGKKAEQEMLDADTSKKSLRVKLKSTVLGEASWDGWSCAGWGEYVYQQTHIVDDTMVAWCYFGDLKTGLERLGRIPALYFDTFIGTKGDDGLIKFNDKIDARDFLKFIIVPMKERHGKKISPSEFAIVCSSGEVYDYTVK
jgi:hypothetical protein